MAQLKFHAPTGEIALSANTAKTLLTIVAPSNIRVLLKGIEIFFKGTSSTDTPVKVDIFRFSTDGTGTSQNFYVNDENAGETVQTTGKNNYSAEPTLGNIIKTWEIHPQTGLVVYFPPGEEIVIKGGNKLGIRATPTQSETVSLNGYLEE